MSSGCASSVRYSLVTLKNVNDVSCVRKASIHTSQPSILQLKNWIKRVRWRKEMAKIKVKRVKVSECVSVPSTSSQRLENFFWLNARRRWKAIWDCVDSCRLCCDIIMKPTLYIWADLCVCCMGSPVCVWRTIDAQNSKSVKAAHKREFWREKMPERFRAEEKTFFAYMQISDTSHQLKYERCQWTGGKFSMKRKINECIWIINDVRASSHIQIHTHKQASKQDIFIVDVVVAVSLGIFVLQFSE